MQVCLFDIDGTLLNSGGAGKAAIEAALVEEFCVELRTQVPFAGRTDRAIGRDLLQFHDIEPTATNWQRLVLGYLSRLPAALARHNGQVLPGIGPLLESLKERGVTVGLLTGNIREGARAKLTHYDLWRQFVFGGFGDEHYERDEVARVALAAVHAHLNGSVSPDRVWVIGDTPLDVRCARAIGAKAVAVATGWHTFQQLEMTSPDLLIRDFSDAEPFLRMLQTLPPP